MIPAEYSHLYVAAVTHPGMKGKNNEDRYAVSAYYTDPQKSIPSVLAIVSDGIGGHRAGEVAAEMAVEIISQTIADSDANNPQDILNQAVIQASDSIRKQSLADSSQKGMGATCAIAWIIADRLYTASVGDSRIYLVRDHTINKLSTDHTWIQEAIEHGVITPDQARRHPNAHVIHRYLGSQRQVIPDLRLRLHAEESDTQAEANQGLRLKYNDQLVLCSDGLTDLVNDWEILSALESRSLNESLESLVDLANERGGHDNITIIALQVPPVDVVQPEIALPVAIPASENQAISPEAKTQPLVLAQPAPAETAGPSPAAIPLPEARKRNWMLLGCLGVAAILVLSFSIVGAIGLYGARPKPTAPVQITQVMVATSPAITPLPGTISTNPVPGGPLLTPTLIITPQPTYTPWPVTTTFPFLNLPTQINR